MQGMERFGERFTKDHGEEAVGKQLAKRGGYGEGVRRKNWPREETGV